MEDKNIRKILVINLGGIGDVLISTPALRALKAHFPGSRLYLLVVPRAAEICRNLGYVDKVFVFDSDRPGWKALSNLTNILKLRSAKIDLAINMRTMVTDSSAAKMRRIMDLVSPRIKAGRDTAGRGDFLDIKIPEEDIGEKYEMDYDIETVRALGAQVNDRKIDLMIDEKILDRVQRLLKDNNIAPEDIIIAIHPGGKPSHRWPENNFVQALKSIETETKAKFVITGSFDEAVLAEQIIKKSGIKALNLAGKLTIQELAGLLKRCNLYITNDTGSMHIAAVMNTPLIAIFGPGYFKRYDPRNIFPQAAVLYKQELCSPCNKFACQSVKCLKSISIEEVIQAARSILSQKKG